MGKILATELIQRDQQADRGILDQETASSSRFDQVLNATTTAPAIAAPKNVSTHSGRLFISSPIRSPRRTPRVVKNSRDPLGTIGERGVTYRFVPPISAGWAPNRAACSRNNWPRSRLMGMVMAQKLSFSDPVPQDVFRELAGRTMR